MKKVILFLGIILFIFVFAGLGCKKTGDNQQTQTPSTAEIFTKSPSDYDADFNAAKQVANTQAKLWASDAKLVYLNTKIPLSLRADQVVHNFVYDSGKFASSHLTFAVTAGTKKYVRAIIPKVDYLGNDLSQILPLYWKINFIDALQKCDNNGGKTFRDEHEKDFTIQLNLYRASDSSQIWQCQYQTYDQQTTKEILINASSGEVIIAN